MMAVAIPASQAAEVLAQGWMRALGFSDACVTRPARDGGVAVRSINAVAQVGRLATAPVGAPEVQLLRGAGYRHPHVLFYSWTGYTREAVDFAETHGVALFTVRDGVPYAESQASMELVAARTARPVRRRLSQAYRRRQQRAQAKAPGATDGNGSGERQHSSRETRTSARSKVRGSERLVSLVARRTLRPSMAERVTVTIMWRILVNMGRVVASGARRLRTSFLVAWRRPTGRRKIIAVIAGLLVVGLAGAALDSIAGIADPSERPALANAVLSLVGAAAGFGMYRLLKIRDWPSSKGRRPQPQNEDPDLQSHHPGAPE